MRKITNRDSQRKVELVKRLDGAYDAVVKAVEEYNSAVSDANGFRDDIANEIENSIDDKSERWQQSDAAESYREWLAAWQEEIEDMDVPDKDSLDTFRDLDEEVSL